MPDNGTGARKSLKKLAYCFEQLYRLARHHPKVIEGLNFGAKRIVKQFLQGKSNPQVLESFERLTFSIAGLASSSEELDSQIDRLLDPFFSDRLENSSELSPHLDETLDILASHLPNEATKWVALALAGFGKRLVGRNPKEALVVLDFAWDLRERLSADCLDSRERKQLAVRWEGLGEARVHAALACSGREKDLASRYLECAIATVEATRSRRLLDRIGEELEPRLETANLTVAEREHLLRAWNALLMRRRAAVARLEALGRSEGGLGNPGSVGGMRLASSVIQVEAPTAAAEPGGFEQAREAATKMAAARADLEVCEWERSVLLQRIRKYDPGFDERRPVPTADFNQAMATLGPRTACLYYVLAEDRLYGFVLRRGAPVWGQGLMERKAFEVLGQRWNTLVKPPAGGGKEVQRMWQQAMQKKMTILLKKISQTLLAPMMTQLADVKELLVVADAWALLIPFAALPFEDGVAADRFVFRQATSLSLLRLVQQRYSLTGEGELMVVAPDGDLVFPQLEAAVRKGDYSNLEVLEGRSASVENFAARASGKHTLWFSGHGVSESGEPTQSRLVMYGGEALTVDRIYAKLNLRGTHRVVLNACQTGQLWADGSRNYEGLVSGFLFSGASQVVGTLWPVIDLASTLLLLRFEKEIRKGRPGPEALRRAAAWLRGKDPKGLVNGRRVADVLAGYIRSAPGAPEELVAAWHEEVNFWRRRARKVRPFESPFFWAAHYVSGDVPERYRALGKRNRRGVRRV
jgi:CHAT domain-containing protein